MLFFFIPMFFCFVGPVYAVDVTLAWSPNTESDVEGYNLYYKTGFNGTPYNGVGATEGNAPITISTDELYNPDQPEFTIHGLNEDETYHFVLTAYDIDGYESAYSVEVSFNSADYDTINSENPDDLTGDSSFDEGDSSFDEGDSSFDEGDGPFDEGDGSFDEGDSSFDEGDSSFDEGDGPFDEGDGSFDEGDGSFDGGDSGGCFIATAAHGSLMAPHVKILCEFRDRILLTHSIGKSFVDFYYKYSPPAADFIADHRDLRAMVRVIALYRKGLKKPFKNNTIF